MKISEIFDLCNRQGLLQGVFIDFKAQNKGFDRIYRWFFSSKSVILIIS